MLLRDPSDSKGLRLGYRGVGGEENAVRSQSETKQTLGKSDMLKVCLIYLPMPNYILISILYPTGVPPQVPLPQASQVPSSFQPGAGKKQRSDNVKSEMYNLEIFHKWSPLRKAQSSFSVDGDGRKRWGQK